MLSISSSLSISHSRMEGYKTALHNYRIPLAATDVVMCGNDATANRMLIKKLLKQKKRPDGIIAAVEKLITFIYMCCGDLGLFIPGAGLNAKKEKALLNRL